MSKKITILLAMLIAQISLFAQITIINDFDPGINNGFDTRQSLVSLGEKAYFVGYDGVAPKTFLCSTNGNAISPTPSVSNINDPRLLTKAGNALYFSAFDSDLFKDVLCTTTTTKDSIKPLASFNRAVSRIFPTGSGNAILFTVPIANSSKENILFYYDGISSLVTLDTFNIPYVSNISTFKNNTIISDAGNIVPKTEAIITDGTVAGTKFLKDFLSPAIKFEEILYIASAKDKIFIEGKVKAADGTISTKNYITDGTITGTFPLKVGFDYDYKYAYEINGTFIVASSINIFHYDAVKKELVEFSVDKGFSSIPILYKNKVYFHNPTSQLSVADPVTKKAKELSTTSSGDEHYILTGIGDSLFFNIKSEQWKVINLKTDNEHSFATIDGTNQKPSIANVKNQLVFWRKTTSEGIELWTLKTAAPLSVFAQVTTTIACNGGLATVTALAAGGKAPYTYVWSTNPTNGQLKAGSYTMTVTDAAGAKASGSLTITEPTAIVLTTASTSSSTGSNGTTTVTAVGGTPTYTYTWSTTPVQTKVTATNLAPGTYTVTVTDKNNCKKTASVQVKNTINTNENWEKYNFSVFPNPVSKTLNITYSGIVVEKFEARLIDVTGKIILKNEMTTTQNTIDVTTIPDGIYILSCIVNGEALNSTVIIQR